MSVVCALMMIVGVAFDVNAVCGFSFRLNHFVKCAVV